MQCGNMLFQLFSVSLAIETASSVGRGRDSTGEWSERERAMWSSPPSSRRPAEMPCAALIWLFSRVTY